MFIASRVFRAATDPTAASRVTASVRLQRERGRHHARGLLSIVTVVAWVISAWTSMPCSSAAAIIGASQRPVASIIVLLLPQPSAPRSAAARVRS